MKRRLISFLLALTLLAGTVAICTPSVSAAYDMKASDDIIELIKHFEGFVPMPKGDYGNQSTIGYGTVVDPDDYPNGITKEEADKLLREAVARFEQSVNYFAKKNKLNFSQHQFDALISFTYNLGANWLNNDSTLRRAVINGATGNDFLYAFTMWCTAGNEGQKQILDTLVKRRLIEANVYLNGVYSKSVPSNYDFVLFNTKMTDAANTARIQGYDSDLTASIRPNPTKSGYRFLGWYTKASGGEWVTTLDASMAGDTLYGHWQKGDGDSKGVAANYKRVTTKSVSVYSWDSQKVVKELAANTTVTVTADYMDANGVKWGKVDGGWIQLSKTKAPGETSGTEEIKVTVNTDGVNIRKGPGTNYAKIGKANKGDVLTITATQMGYNYLWGKFSGGWICLDYTDYDDVVAQIPTNEEITATGVIVKTDKLNVRNRPGTNETKVVDSYSRGDVVTITLQQTVRGTVWGKTPKGWISLYYVDVTPVGSGDTTEKPGDSESEETPAGKPIATGIIVDCITLRVRKGPGTTYEKVGSIAAGTEVEIYETTGGGQQLWGRIDKGWISMNYVELEVEVPESGEGKPGVVYNCDKLNVRSGPGTSNRKVARIDAGTKVQVFETTEVKGVQWGRISLGWVSMEYIKLDGEEPAEPEKPETETPETEKPETEKPESGTSGNATAQSATIVKTDELRVRAGAGTQYDKVGTLKKGDRVVILETAKVGNATWARIDQGWIHMYYVQLDNKEVPSGAVYKTVTTEVRIRAGAGTQYDKVGTYSEGDVVLIYEQTTVKNRPWGRTDKGWICLDYVR